MHTHKRVLYLYPSTTLYELVCVRLVNLHRDRVFVASRPNETINVHNIIIIMHRYKTHIYYYTGPPRYACIALHVLSVDDPQHHLQRVCLGFTVSWPKQIKTEFNLPPCQLNIFKYLISVPSCVSFTTNRVELLPFSFHTSGT